MVVDKWFPLKSRPRKPRRRGDTAKATPEEDPFREETPDARRLWSMKIVIITIEIIAIITLMITIAIVTNNDSG